MIDAMETTFLPYLLPGDTIMLSSGAGSGGSAANVAALDSWLSKLQPHLPAGVAFEARTSGLANVQTIASGVGSAFEGIVYDYEPGFEPEFSLNFTTTLHEFENFSRICHAEGFKAFGYPFSAPLWSAGDREYGWNFGELAATTGVDSLQIQLQGAAHESTKIWNSSIQTLIAQYAAYGLPASAISVQLTLAAGDPNNISVGAAYADYEYAIGQGVRQVVLWWNSASIDSVESLLALIRG